VFRVSFDNRDTHQHIYTTCTAVYNELRVCQYNIVGRIYSHRDKHLQRSFGEIYIKCADQFLLSGIYSKFSAI
jgi:hypothetical protein